jgi:transposase-like protein
MVRPNKGLGHVDLLVGDPESKWRLQVILATLTGEMLVDEAYEALEVGPTQFANLRKRALQGAHDALLPRPGGRPRKEVTATAEELAALRARNAELERQLAEMRARVEVAILPFLGNKHGGKRRAKGEPGRGE